WIFEIVEPFARGLVAAVDDPSVGLEQDGRPEIPVGVPPIARTRGRTAGAQNAFIEPVELGAILARLFPFLWRRRGIRLQPRLDRAVLSVEVRHIRYQVLDDLHVRQGIDFDRAR